MLARGKPAASDEAEGLVAESPVVVDVRHGVHGNGIGSGGSAMATVGGARA